MSGSRPAPEPRLEEVAPGVWAYIQPDGSWYLNNAAFLVGRDGVVLVDTTSTERRARALLAAVQSVTDAPVRTVVNTHHHGDHTHGNYLLPAATVIGQDRCRPEVVAAGLLGTALFPDVEWGDIKVAPPFVTFSRDLTVWVDDLEVRLLHFGMPAHTTNDVVAWLPSRRLLLAGDLVFNGGCPLVMQGSVAGSLSALAEVRALAPERIVPGHGPVCDLSALDGLERYLRFVQEVAAEGVAAGWAPLEAAVRRRADLAQFAEWGETERLAPNLHRAYSELRGEPLGTALDVGAMVADMLAFNGGVPRCLA
ncbi:MAG TPA: MBL fold metallo-hydrolase [Acidimicrobiales bacterium]|nr:MBL fold metallo-hydrolase [Acidimicrobiales bacterium]